MNIHQYDDPRCYRFRLQGNLEGSWVQELRYAWKTASSILKGRELIVDVAGIEKTDRAGLELLCEMQNAGASLIAPGKAASPTLAATLGIVSAPKPDGAPGAARGFRGLIRLLRLAIQE